MLGLIEDDVRLVFAGVGRRQNPVRGKDQVPEGGFLLDDLCVVLDVGRARHAVDQRGDVRGAPDFLEIAGAAQLLLQRHQIDRVAALGKADHLVEDTAMRVAEKILRVDHLGGEVERVVVQQDRAEHRPFGLEVVRKRPLGYYVWHFPLEGRSENSEGRTSDQKLQQQNVQKKT